MNERNPNVQMKFEVRSETPPTLQEAQEFVGGLVQEVPMHRREDQMFVNEEGLLMGLEYNPEASRIAGQPIVGPALLLKGDARWK